MGYSGFIKATLKGGLLFLVPVAFLAIILGKAFEMILKVAKPVGDWLPVESFCGIAIANLIAIFILLAICFAAGLVANMSAVRLTVDRFEVACLIAVVLLTTPHSAYAETYDVVINGGRIMDPETNFDEVCNDTCLLDAPAG